MRTVLVLVRHGESTLNVEGRVQGVSNASRLTAAGIRQAHGIARWLGDLGVQEIHSSPLRRALDTATTICDHAALKCVPLTVVPYLCEIDFGTWTGLSKAHVRSVAPEQYAIWRAAPWEFELDGRFPVRDLYATIEPYAAALANDEAPFTRRLVIGHKGSLSALVGCLLGLPRSHHHMLQLDRGSVTVLRERRRSPTDGVSYELVTSNLRPHAPAGEPVDFRTEERTRSAGEVYLVRHGPTARNFTRRFQGTDDVPLSVLGRETVNDLAGRFRPSTPILLLHSPLRRAHESAVLIGRRLRPSQVECLSDLRELGYGEWQGHSVQEVASSHPVAYQTWLESPGDAVIPRGERLQDATERAARSLARARLWCEATGGACVIVAHDVINRLMLCLAVGLNPGSMWSFRFINSAVSVVALKPRPDGVLRVLNHSPFELQENLSNEWL